MDQKSTDAFNTERRTTKTLGDVIGLPDEEDKQRIQQYLLKYEATHPGEIQFHRDAARAHFAAEGGDKQKYGIVNKAASGRTLFELPEEVGHWMEQAYPYMFRDKKHLQWFIEQFKELLIPEQY